MSTYYYLRCPKCEEVGGFYSRQMWGWGNANLFMNFKFMVAHTECGTLEIVSEHDETEDEQLRWLERLSGDEWLRDQVWPHAREWQDVADSWEGSHEKFREELAEQLAIELKWRAKG